MRYPSRLAISLVAAGLLSFGVSSQAKPIEFSFTEDQSKTTIDIIDKLSTRHYRNQNFDDDLSSKMLDKYIDSLDPSKSFFLQSDIDRITKRYATKLDDELNNGNLEGGREIFVTYYDRAHSRLSWIIEQLSSEDSFNFDFSKDEYLAVGEQNRTWPKNDKQAQELWRKRIKSSALSLKLADESMDEARETLLRRYKNQLKRLEQQDADDVFETLINALTLLYDPHTSYFSPRTLENFNISMSLSLEGIGAVLQTEDEFTKVVRLISAGPAAKQGVLKPADKIVAVGQGEDGDMVDVVGWRLDEVVKLIRGPKNTVVRLKIMPADDAGMTKEIRISRAKVKLEEQAAKKGILELTDGEEVFKLGVINVPAFYIDFEAYRRRDPNYKSTTGDVKRLLEELDQEGIDGLIVDLRNNGGGSLQEATKLTDLFIDQGPVVQIRQTSQTISRNYRSRSRAKYRGPLVVLTNRLSASASEIFAGAIQDYQRGLIVGAQSFGKGTVQSLTPVHSGQLKITESKFYRVSGDSTQHRGVIPDVNFPFLVDAEEVGESSYDTALPWDQIHPVPHEAYYNFSNIIKDVIAKHEERKAIDPDFIFLDRQLANIKENKERTEVSLNEAKRAQEQEGLKLKALNLENQRRQSKGLEEFKTVDDWEKDRSERIAEASEQAASKELHTDDDALLSEAGYILIDMINSLEKLPPDRVANFK